MFPPVLVRSMLLIILVLCVVLFFFVCLRPVSCVTNVASFSVLSIQIILGVFGNTVFFNVYLKHCKDS